MKRKEILEIAIMLIATLLLIFVCNNMNYIISDYVKYYANKELAAFAK